ncbi:NADH-quinone oxidoreductase subunit A [Kineococcus arenarius]|uniref:NADH-quinone oxidoreductase subunit A n=1 Tax=unclassified Kineococcus TaxID=2621656 RepID=UPI003D7C7259
MSSYLGLVSMSALALLGIGGVYLLARTTAVAPDPVRSLPFLSGHDPAEHALSRFHVRWYPVTLIFLAFDVEMLFMYPWAVVVAQMGAGAVIEMFVFLGVLLAGVAWAWREGALRWV